MMIPRNHYTNLSTNKKIRLREDGFEVRLA